MTVKAYAATEAGGILKPFEYPLGDLKPDEVDIAVDFCGICHSDLSMLQNDWRMTKYPFVPGHEVAGKVIAIGSQVKHLEIGQRVGLGWNSASCLTCEQCMSGNHNLCATKEDTIIGRYGGFADKVRTQAVWAIPLPDGVNSKTAGPLFCGGVTVFNPIIQNNISPLHRVGVVGIGGLGHMALAFLKAWGCEVIAFSTSPEKEAEAKRLGAHKFVSTYDKDALKKLRNSLDMVLVTVNVELDWETYLRTLRPKGILHIVGAANSVKSRIGFLMGQQRSISASPVGSPHVISKMLEFVERHQIEPMVEMYQLSDVNEAFEKLKHGKPRYRVVLEIGK